MRAAFDGWGKSYSLPEGAATGPKTLGGVGTLKVSVPRSRADRALLYMHGGGYATRSLKSHRHLVGQLCEASGFVGYALGNLISAQLHAAARRDLPDLDGRLAAGEFAPLLGWLREHVHRHGRKLTPDELVERATGRPIEAGPWIAYVREKFSALYGL